MRIDKPPILAMHGKDNQLVPGQKTFTASNQDKLNTEGNDATEIAINTPLPEFVDRVKNRHKISLKDVVPEDYREEV